jgi:hypothetical protein
VNPVRINPQRENQVYLRPLSVKSNASVEIRLDNRLIRTVKKSRIQPSEMIMLNIGPGDFPGQAVGPDSVLEIGCK